MFYEKEGIVEHLTFHLLCILYIKRLTWPVWSQIVKHPILGLFGT